jgi:hypothetical protein
LLVSLGPLLAVPGSAALVNKLHQMFPDGTVWITTVDDGPKAMVRLNPDGFGTFAISPVVQPIKWTEKAMQSAFPAVLSVASVLF